MGRAACAEFIIENRGLRMAVVEFKIKFDAKPFIREINKMRRKLLWLIIKAKVKRFFKGIMRFFASLRMTKEK